MSEGGTFELVFDDGSGSLDGLGPPQPSIVAKGSAIFRCLYDLGGQGSGR